MNKKTINVDDIVNFAGEIEDIDLFDDNELNKYPYENDGDFEEEYEEENFLEDDYENKEFLKGDYENEEFVEKDYYTDFDNDVNSKKNIDEDCNESSEDECCYYTECNYTCKNEDDDDSYFCEEDSTEDDDVCEEHPEKCEIECKDKHYYDKKIYDDGYKCGYTDGYEKAKQEVLDYVNSRKRRCGNCKCYCSKY